MAVVSKGSLLSILHGVVYCIGLWTKDMKHKTNLQQTQVTKILKQLESRNLVKAIKPVNQPSKKFYMLFDLEPAREITGGAW